MSEKKKTCFVVSPIGIPNSETRIRADKVLRHIIRPAAEKFQYNVIRADEITKPGMISTDMFTHLIDDELVIADLTGHNPNVFYELAIRHAVYKPVIQIIAHDEKIPFDVLDTRTISFNYQDLDSAANARDAIMKQIQHIQDAGDDATFDNPLKNAILQRDRLSSGDSEQKDIAHILEILSRMQRDIDTLKAPTRGIVSKWRPNYSPEISYENERAELVDRIQSLQSTQQLIQSEIAQGIDESDKASYLEMQLQSIDDELNYLEHKLNILDRG